MRLSRAKECWPVEELSFCPVCGQEFDEESDLVRDDSRNFELVHRECALETTD